MTNAVIEKGLRFPLRPSVDAVVLPARPPPTEIQEQRSTWSENLAFKKVVEQVNWARVSPRGPHEGDEKLFAVATHRFPTGLGEPNWKDNLVGLRLSDPAFLEKYPLIRELINDYVVEKLEGVGQMTAGASSRVLDDHGLGIGPHRSRLYHSLSCLVLAIDLIERSNVTDQKTAYALMCGALLHDIGHEPFSHLSEDFRKEVGLAGSPDGGSVDYDHDKRRVEIINEAWGIGRILDAISATIIKSAIVPTTITDTTEIFAENSAGTNSITSSPKSSPSGEAAVAQSPKFTGQPSPSDFRLFMADIFSTDPKDPHAQKIAKIIEDIIDLVDYKVDDTRATRLAPDVVRRIQENGKEVFFRTRINSDNDVYLDFSDYAKVGTCRKEQLHAARELFTAHYADRAIIYQEINTHPAAVLADQLRKEELLLRHEKQAFTLAQFPYMNNSDVQNHFGSSVKKMFNIGENGRITAKANVDENFECLCAVSLAQAHDQHIGKLTGRQHLLSDETAAALRSAIAKELGKNLGMYKVVVCKMKPYDKKDKSFTGRFTFAGNANLIFSEDVTLHTNFYTNHDTIKLFVAISKDTPEHTRTKLTEAFRRIVSPLVKKDVRATFDKTGWRGKESNLFSQPVEPTLYR